MVIKMNILVTLPKGVISDSFVPAEVRERLEQLGNVEYNETYKNFTPDELKEKLRGKDAVITGWGTERIDGSVLEGNSTLKLIAHTGGSVNSITDKSTYDGGIRVISGNDIYAESVAEAVIAYALTALRKIPDYCARTRNGGWYRSGEVWEGLIGQKVGMIGFGMITKHLAEFLKPFHTDNYVYSGHCSDEELKSYGLKKAGIDEIFESCKVISLNCALNDKTRHMVSTELLGKLRDGAVLINTSRGPVIDEAALGAALEKKNFRAVLDVFEQEPLPENHFLRTNENVYAVPHMGGPTYDRRRIVTLRLADDIERYFRGEPLKYEITGSYAAVMTKEK